MDSSQQFPEMDSNLRERHCQPLTPSRPRSPQCPELSQKKDHHSEPTDLDPVWPRAGQLPILSLGLLFGNLGFVSWSSMWPRVPYPQPQRGYSTGAGWGGALPVGRATTQPPWAQGFSQGQCTWLEGGNPGPLRSFASDGIARPPLHRRKERYQHREIYPDLSQGVPPLPGPDLAHVTAT